MWIFLNDAFFSIVEDHKNPLRFAVRARHKGDLEKVFLVSPKAVLETPQNDYRFRVFLPKDIVIKRLTREMEMINYGNFKDSMDPNDKARKAAYNRVWCAMYDWQDREYPPEEDDQWWKYYKYRNADKYDPADLED